MTQHSNQVQSFIEELGNGINLEMVMVPNGRFMMGSAPEAVKAFFTTPEILEFYLIEAGCNLNFFFYLVKCWSNTEAPPHSVTVPSFKMARYPMTQAQWRAIAAFPRVNRELNPDPARFKGDYHPVERVNWWDAVECCDRLSQQTGRPYRLPTEAEWEYGCCAGTITPFHVGEMITTDQANCRVVKSGDLGLRVERINETTPVDYFKLANAFGLCDMHGNVREWCLDHYHETYKDAPIDGRSWLTEDRTASRVTRGGSYIDYLWDCRSTSRHREFPSMRYNFIGFRLACDHLPTL